eukprot:Partr_v1_DN27873_c1_g1_i2_m22459
MNQVPNPNRPRKGSADATSEEIGVLIQPQNKNFSAQQYQPGMQYSNMSAQQPYQQSVSPISSGYTAFPNVAQPLYGAQIPNPQYPQYQQFQQYQYQQQNQYQQPNQYLPSNQYQQQPQSNYNAYPQQASSSVPQVQAVQNPPLRSARSSNPQPPTAINQLPVRSSSNNVEPSPQAYSKMSAISAQIPSPLANTSGGSRSGSITSLVSSVSPKQNTPVTRQPQPQKASMSTPQATAAQSQSSPANTIGRNASHPQSVDPRRFNIANRADSNVSMDSIAYDEVPISDSSRQEIVDILAAGAKAQHPIPPPRLVSNDVPITPVAIPIPPPAAVVIPPPPVPRPKASEFVEAAFSQSEQSVGQNLSAYQTDEASDYRYSDLVGEDEDDNLAQPPAPSQLLNQLLATKDRLKAAKAVVSDEQRNDNTLDDTLEKLTLALKKMPADSSSNVFATVKDRRRKLGESIVLPDSEWD